MTRPLALCVVGLVAVAICLTGHSAEKRAAGKTTAAFWPGWRGPHRDDISTDTGLLDKWPEGGPPLAWKGSGLGRGFSSVSIADGRIFTMGDREGGEFVIALGLADGKELWSTRISDVWAPDGYAGPRCTPTIDGPRIYVLGPHGDLVCLEAASGKEVWHRNMKNDFGGRMHSGWGYSESPLVDGDRLVCTPGGDQAAIVALDKLTGTELWRSAVPALGDHGGDGAAYSSIVIGNGGGVRQYVQLMGRGVVGVADDGKFLWGYNRVANRTANIPTPLVHGDYVFCSSGYQTGAALLKLEPAGGGAVKAEEVYFLEGKEMQNHHGGMVMLGDYVYCGHGHNAGAPTCLEWKTGDVKWREKRGPGSGSAAVAYADGHLYFRYQDGTMALITATPQDYELRGTFKIPGVEQPSWAHPVITGGKLYLREQDAIYCYDVKK